tara:strand:- start:667 stop:957 length:291 start_codon:yes stop_codon:yes gene_type:complete
MAYSYLPAFNNKTDIEEIIDIIGQWSNNIVLDLESRDAAVNIRKVAIKETGSITVAGRVNISDVNSTVTAQAGDMRFNSTTNKFQGYDGTAWRDFH